MQRKRVITEEGRELALTCHGGVYELRLDGMELMSSREHRSEEALARLACASLPEIEEPTVLIGGLGLGFTLRAALDHLPTGARVTVAEIFPAVVTWNRSLLGSLAGHPLEDPRVDVAEIDVAELLAGRTELFDLIVLDVDNGPDAVSRPGNRRLYTNAYLSLIRKRLKKDGRLAVWSSSAAATFLSRLREAGFQVEHRRIAIPAGARQLSHNLYLAS